MVSLATTKREHGKSRYDLGCRCRVCATAKSRARKLARDRARAENSPSYQRELAASRRLKEGYRGACVECGASTNGSAGKGKASRRCVPCASKLNGLARRGTGANQTRLLALLARRGSATYSEIRGALSLASNGTSPLLSRAVQLGLVVRVSRGVYRLPGRGRT